jgi:hypothetical protein
MGPDCHEPRAKTISPTGEVPQPKILGSECRWGSSLSGSHGPVTGARVLSWVRSRRRRRLRTAAARPPGIGPVVDRRRCLGYLTGGVGVAWSRVRSFMLRDCWSETNCSPATVGGP